MHVHVNVCNWQQWSVSAISLTITCMSSLSLSLTHTHTHTLSLLSLSGQRVSLVDSRTNHHHMQCMLLEVSPSITTLHAHACTCTCPTCIHVRTLYSIVLQYCNIVSALSERNFLTGDIYIECSTCIFTTTFVCVYKKMAEWSSCSICCTLNMYTVIGTN